MSIKEYIKNNLKDCSENDINETIVESISSDDEVVLPGLGVLFEMLWNNSDNELKNNITNILYKATKKV